MTRLLLLMAVNPAAGKQLLSQADPAGKQGDHRSGRVLSSTLPKRIGQRAVAVLDWLWPFPLGIVFGGLLFLIAAGSWLALRGPAPTTERASASNRGPELSAPAPSNAAQPAALEDAPERPGLQPAANRPTASSSPTRPFAASTPSPSERASRAPAPKPEVVSAKPLQRAPDVVTMARPVPSQPQAKEPPPPSKPSVAAAANKLSSAQETELNDKLTLGGFFMDRKDYRAALTEFQAALAIDPSNRAAQAALQKAREASQAQESTSQP